MTVARLATSLVFFFVATSEDFSPLLLMPLIFSPQSVNGTRSCANLTVFADNLVECDKEIFTVTIDLATADESFRITNDITTVTIINIDGVYPDLVAST